MEHGFSGVWLSHYKYHSTSRGADFEGDHTVRIYQKDDQLVVESLPDVNKSYLILRLSLDDNVLTGSWHEHTEPDGHYKGTIYHGAIQMIVKDKDHIEGKWLGFSKKGDINVGPWQLTRQKA